MPYWVTGWAFECSLKQAHCSLLHCKVCSKTWNYKRKTNLSMSFVILPRTIICMDVYTPMEKFRHRKYGHFSDVVNVLKVSNMFECVFTGCSRVGAKITANDRISVGDGTGWAEGKGLMYNPVPRSSSFYRSGKNTGHSTSAKPAVDQSGCSTGFITDAGTKVRLVMQHPAGSLCCEKNSTGT